MTPNPYRPSINLTINHQLPAKCRIHCHSNYTMSTITTLSLDFSFQIPDPDVFLKASYNCSEPPPYIVNSSSTYKQQKNLLYPINVGRNIARSSALTHFVLPSDIELYPSPDLAPKFLNMIARNEVPLSTSNKPRVFPISLFEVDKNYFVSIQYYSYVLWYTYNKSLQS